MNDFGAIDRGVGVILKSGQSTSVRWDDVEWMGGLPETPKIITGETLSERVTEMPERWIRARVRGWMEQIESPDLDFWIGTFVGREWIFCSSRKDSFFPLQHRMDYARQVCRHVNKQCGHGGVWLVGWIRGGNEFYLLWKDPAGDIKCPIECDEPFNRLLGWTATHWEFHCNNAVQRVRDFERAMELGTGQEKKLAQGDTIDESRHLQEAPAIGI